MLYWRKCTQTIAKGNGRSFQENKLIVKVGTGKTTSTKIHTIYLYIGKYTRPYMEEDW